jgi:ATP-binding cassette subfamily C exporter for protease/lipase
MLIASILGGRGIGPLVQLITQWQIIPMTVRAYQQVDAALKAIPPQASALSLPEPTGRLSIERLYAKPPGSDAMTLKGIQAELPAGASMAVIGPSAAGKSSLAKCLVGVWEPDGGSVRLDGANLHRWPKEQLGRFVGYLPQEVELFEGSLGDNISRFEAPSAERDAALDVAIRIAGLSDLVKQLPKGLETALGPDGQFFSGGQRQRVGLARAIYGMPKLVVMDEPDAHLDEAGDRALAEAIVALRAQRCSVVVITHRKELLALMDSVLVIHDGQLAAFGPRDQVLKAIEGARKPMLQEASQT